MLTELELFLSRSPERFYRIGTGEFADSLAIDDYLDINKDLINFISSKKNAVLELKTKSDKIEKLMSSDPKDNIIISWSLNTPRVIQTEEKNTPTLEERLTAAKKCFEKGYWIGFHFDPLINYEGWEKEYKDVIGKIFKYVSPERVAWISLGALRFSEIPVTPRAPSYHFGEMEKIFLYNVFILDILWVGHTVPDGFYLLIILKRNYGAFIDPQGHIMQPFAYYPEFIL